MKPGLKLIVVGFCLNFLPLFVVAPAKKYLTADLFGILSLLILLICFYGYIVFIRGCCKYCKDKGYSSRWGWFGIFSLLVLPFLFLLKPRIPDGHTDQEILLEKNKFKSISVSELILSYFSVATLIVIIFGYFANEPWSKNLTIERFLDMIISIFMVLFLYKYFKNSALNWKFFMNFKRSINFIEIAFIAVLNFLFSMGFSKINLYFISFIFPKYVENYLNEERYFDNIPSFILFTISAVIIAPFLEELLMRGMILHTIAVNRGVVSGLLLSSLIFSLFHLRFDVIPLFLIGIILGIFYLRTKNLMSSMIYHAFYNMLVCVYSLYHFLASQNFEKEFIVLSEYQKHAQKSLRMNILLVTISLPYLLYFIYKNWPKKNQVLPYFANEQEGKSM